MQLSFGRLKEMIRQRVLAESQHYDEVTLLDGATSSYGSLKHVADMEKIVAGLECIRNQQRRGTAARSIYSAAVAQLKSQLRKTLRHIDQPKTYRVESEEPGRVRRPKPGFGGGIATVPGHGRYNPGDVDSAD